MTAPKIAFVYLLNRMENAASAKEPFKAGFGEHRKAVVEHVNRIETELADARAALREMSETVFGSWINKETPFHEDGRFGCNHCSIRFDSMTGWPDIKHDDCCGVEKARNFLAKSQP